MSRAVAQVPQELLQLARVSTRGKECLQIYLRTVLPHIPLLFLIFRMYVYMFSFSLFQRRYPNTNPRCLQAAVQAFFDPIAQLLVDLIIKFR